MQSEKGFSLKNQFIKIKEYCQFMDYELLDVFEDRGISGMSIEKRDGYKEMVEYLLNNDIDGIVVYSLSRLGRRMKDVIEFMEVLKKNNISFISIKENLNNNDKIGSLILNIMSSINEFEVETLRDRIKDVKREKKKNGLVYGRLMYGYDNVDGKLVKNEKEFKVIKRIKNLRSRGWTWKRISEKLNEDGIRSKEGKIWYDGSLYNCLKSYI